MTDLEDFTIVVLRHRPAPDVDLGPEWQVESRSDEVGRWSGSARDVAAALRLAADEVGG